MTYNYTLNYPTFGNNYGNSFYPPPSLTLGNYNPVFNENTNITSQIATNANNTNNNLFGLDPNKPITAQTIDVQENNLVNVPNLTPESEESSLKSELLMTGGLMGSTMVIPKLATFTDSKNAIATTTNAIKSVANTKTVEEAARVATLYGDIFNSYRLENSIKAAGLSPQETKKILQKIGNIRNEYEYAVKTGNAIKMAECKAELEVILKEAKSPNIFSKTWAWIKTNIFKRAPKDHKSYNDISKAAKQAGTKAAAGAKAVTATNASAWAKGAAWLKDANKAHGFKCMAIIEGLVEGITEVFPAFTQGGAVEGTKQVAKSAVNVTASATGWCVGAKGGAWVGAAIGSFICPGIGTAIGGAIGGILGGVLGSWGAKKVAKCVTGDSFSEKQKKENAIQKQAKAELEQQTQAIQSSATQAQQTQETQTVTQTQPTSQVNTLTPDMWSRYFNGAITPQEQALADAKWNEIIYKTNQHYDNGLLGNPFAYC